MSRPIPPRMVEGVSCRSRAGVTLLGPASSFGDSSIGYMDTIGVDWVGGGAGLDVSWWRWTISSFRVSMDTEPPLNSFAMFMAWVHAASGSVRGKAGGIGDGGSGDCCSVMSIDPSSEPKSSAVASSPSFTTNLMCLPSGRGLCLGAMRPSSVSVSTAMAARASSPLRSGGTGLRGSGSAAAAAAAASAAAASRSRGCGSVSRSRYSTRPSSSSSLMSRKSGKWGLGILSLSFSASVSLALNQHLKVPLWTT